MGRYLFMGAVALCVAAPANAASVQAEAAWSADVRLESSSGSLGAQPQVPGSATQINLFAGTTRAAVGAGRDLFLVQQLVSNDQDASASVQQDVSVVPLPATLSLLAGTLGLLAWMRRRQS